MYLVFKLKDLQPLITHTLKAPKHSMGYMSQLKPGPALFLVKDEGIYLMSNGQPGLMAKGGKNHQQVVYAAGHTPADGWLGGDDFAETLELKFFQNALQLRSKEIHITLNDKDIKLEAR